MNMVLAMSPTHRGSPAPHEDADREDQAPPPPVLNKFSRQRRRFVRPGMTIYEHSFSRLASGRRSRRGPEPSAPPGDRLQPLPSSSRPQQAASNSAAEGDAEADGASPCVSSLSSVLDEVINGRSCAVTKFADAAAPAAPTTTYVVRRDVDGTYYVASSDGQRYFADSAIGQVFLGSAPAAAEASAAAAASSSSLSPTSSTRRSDMDFVGSRGWQRVHALKRQSGGSSAELMAHDAMLRPRVDERTDEEDEDDGNGRASPSRPQSKVFRLGSAVKRRVQSVKHRGVSRFSRRSGVEVDIDADDADVGVDIDAAVLGNQEAMHRPSSHENELPMLDASVVDTRGRGDSSWEVPAAPVNDSGAAVHSTAADSSPATATGACTTTSKATTSAAEEQERERGSSDWELAPPDPSLSEDTTSSPSPAFPSRKVPIQPLPRLQLREEKLDTITVNADAADEEDEEEENELMQSFRNVRDIDLVAPRASSFDEDSEQPRESSLSSDNSGSSSSSSDRNSTSVAPTTRSSTSSATYAGRSSGSLDFGAGRIRVSSSGTSIAEFVGGYKSHVSRRAGMGMGLGGPNADAFVSRSRSLRHGRKSPAAQSTPATELGRKLRDARNRIPVEFRDELTPQPKKKRRDGAKSVRFDPTPYVREFEVEEEETDGANGGEQQEPDEIVDAVQLVAKEEVLHAEELFFQEEPDLMFEMSSSDLHDATSGDHGHEFDIDGGGDNPLAFSELRVDKPLNISDL